MFAGIIQSLGTIENINEKTNVVSIKTKLDLSNCKLGSSICCAGVCLTIERINKLKELYIIIKFLNEQILFKNLLT